MPERFRVVCIPYKALYKCSDFFKPVRRAVPNNHCSIVTHGLCLTVMGRLRPVSREPAQMRSGQIIDMQLWPLAQWRHYTRAHQIKWPGWMIHHPGATLAPPCLLLCFASVIVWTKNKNFTISDCWLIAFFICFLLTVKQSQRRWQPLCFEGNGLQLSEEKSASGWTSSRMFWPWNDLAPLLHWCRHCTGQQQTMNHTVTMCPLTTSVRCGETTFGSTGKGKHGFV